MNMNEYEYEYEYAYVYVYTYKTNLRVIRSWWGGGKEGRGPQRIRKGLSNGVTKFKTKKRLPVAPLLIAATGQQPHATKDK